MTPYKERLEAGHYTEASEPEKAKPKNGRRTKPQDAEQFAVEPDQDDEDIEF